MPIDPRILVTGATGYVGGRLLSALQARGLPLRCLARRPEALARRASATAEIVAGDVADAASVRDALRGIETAYYLVHAMAAGAGYAARDREHATAFGRLAREAAVKRIVYLGALGREPGLSEHLRSRQEVGRALADAGVPIIELRASIVLGAGSFSFELVRSLVERLPLMITPRWVHTLAQPIAIADVVSYLVRARDAPPDVHGIFDIGGRDRVAYLGLMREYAHQRGLRRLLIPVPFLTPRLSSLWLRLVTPLDPRMGRALIEGVRSPTVVEDDRASRVFGVRTMGAAQAIAQALAEEDRSYAELDGCTEHADRVRGTSTRTGPRIVETRSEWVACSPEQAFEPIRRLGGTTGWYFANALWRLRGTLDRGLGGPGLSRGRAHPRDLGQGDALDFWRVESFEPPHRMRLAAEMRLPGRAWLQFDVAAESGGARVCQTAIFDPLGISGRLYWYALEPIHRWIFDGMLREIAAAGTRRESIENPTPPALGRT